MIADVSIKHERVFSEVKRLCFAGLDGPELLRRVVSRLRQTVPFDAYFASTTDPATGLSTHLLAGGFREESEARDILLGRVYFEEDLDQLSSMLRERRPVQLLSETTGGKLERSVRYREFLKPLGFRHELGSAFIDGGLWGGLDLIRGTGASDFRSKELGLLRRLAPHIGSGLKSAMLCSQASVKPATDGTPGVLMLDRRGHVLSRNLPARQLISELNGTGSSSGDDLPVAIRMVASAVRRSLAPGTGRELDLIPKVRVLSRSGRWLTLHGSITEPASGQPGETVVVIEPSRPQEIARLNAAAHGLTTREEEVVKLVVSGSSTRQIAGKLHISEYTVQRHLQNTFHKVGVGSRRELLKILFLDDPLPETPSTGASSSRA